jgi:hypothetical protein
VDSTSKFESLRYSISSLKTSDQPTNPLILSKSRHQYLVLVAALLLPSVVRVSLAHLEVKEPNLTTKCRPMHPQCLCGLVSLV